MTTKHTPGRWFADAKGNIWRRPPSDLYQNGGSVAGDKPLAFAFVGWHGENDTGYPVEANARLIAGAPELLEALQELCEIVEDAIEQKNAKDLDSFTLQPARAAIAKATCAQPAPNEPSEFVRKARARFKNELHRSPDAPYPGMSEAFEQHFSQSFTDREWRSESATWAAAWKAAKRHEAQAQPAPSVPDGWKEAAIAWEVCASIHREYGKGEDPFFNTRQGDFVKHANDARAMLAAAQEAKP